MLILRRCLATTTAKSAAQFPGAKNSTFTSKLCFLSTQKVLDSDGQPLSDIDPALTKPVLIKMYENMITLGIMDLILYEAQRQDMTNYGEEATHMGSAEALTLSDVVYGQYREAGVLMHRGFTLDQFMNQCYSNHLDYGKGRQMPVHYGSRELNFQTISSPLCTQLPHAAGAAYAMKRANVDACVICYFGEGAASEGDFHAALNIASTTDAPVIFFCRNNGYAISTPAKEQYRGDGIASRGAGYGMLTIRVDGNDVMAVYNATKEAKRIAISESRPVLIEAMTYRVGHHSTSDDSSAYRSKQEVATWQKKDSPTTRFRKYLESQSYWNEHDEAEFRAKTKKDILTAFESAEKLLKPKVDEMFNDVYDVLTPRLQEQKAELERLMKLYPEEYSQKGFEK